MDAVASVSHQWVPGARILMPSSGHMQPLLFIPACHASITLSLRKQVENGLVLGLKLYSCDLEILNF